MKEKILKFLIEDWPCNDKEEKEIKDFLESFFEYDRLGYIEEEYAE